MEETQEGVSHEEVRTRKLQHQHTKKKGQIGDYEEDQHDEETQLHEMNKDEQKVKRKYSLKKKSAELLVSDE